VQHYGVTRFVNCRVGERHIEDFALLEPVGVHPRLEVAMVVERREERSERTFFSQPPHMVARRGSDFVNVGLTVALLSIERSIMMRLPPAAIVLTRLFAISRPQ
jgi:hypothetical protein